MTKPEIFRARRAAALERMAPASVLLVRSNPEQTRSNDSHFPFRQDSDFHYLTGFGEPDCVALLTNAHAEHRYVLFVRPRDPERETWDGRRAGVEGALAHYGPDAVVSIEELDEKLPAYLEVARTLYFTTGPDSVFGVTVERLLARLRRSRPRTGKGPVTWTELGEVTHELRLRKAAEELTLLRRASAITVEAHNAALAATRPGMGEHEIEALLNYLFRVRGGSGPGYSSIVAGGVNATILHYTENRSLLADGELLLIDAAAEFEGYTADVTRTFPIGARYSAAQRAVYDLVLDAQLAAFARVRPGNRFDDVHRAALEVLVGGLVRLAVLEGTVEELIAKKAFQPFYMHRTGHWLGLDVHDVGLYVDGKGESRALEPGMVLTVEPGLYFGDVAVPYDPKYRGIGVRIEDDVVVTATGCEVLTEGALKRPDEVEAARARRAAVTPLPVS